MYKRLILGIVATLVLTSCASAKSPVAGITVKNAFVRASDAAATAPYMSGAFMVITNGTDADVTLIGGTADFAGMVQVHEVVNGAMQMKEGGLVIKAGATETLQPSGNHLMFVGMQKPALAGEERTFTLSFSDGTALDVTAPVKVLETGAETYNAGMSM